MGLKRLGTTVVAILLGFLASEGFLRALLEPEMLFEFSFSPGAQQQNEDYGFLFTPEFKGNMRNVDKVWGIPLELDRFGYRKAMTSPNAEGHVTSVLFLAGRSSAMGYGLRDEHTVHGRMAELSERPLHVQSTGWAGFDMFRSWKYFERGLGQEEDFDLVLLWVNPNMGELLLKGLPEGLSEVALHPIRHKMFLLSDGIVQVPADALEEWMGRSYFSSYAGYGLLRYRRFVRPTWRKYGRRFGWYNPPKRTAPSEAEVLEQRAAGLERFGQFVALLRDEFADRGSKLGVVFLPTANRKWPRTGYSDLDGALPEDVPRLDLQDALYDVLDPADYIGNGHWNKEQAVPIAEHLLRFTERCLTEETR